MVVARFLIDFTPHRLAIAVQHNAPAVRERRDDQKAPSSFDHVVSFATWPGLDHKRWDQLGATVGDFDAHRVQTWFDSDGKAALRVKERICREFRNAEVDSCAKGDEAGAPQN